MRCSNSKKYNQPQIKLMKGIINYFQINFIEDDCSSQEVEHRNRLFLKRSSTKSIIQVRLRNVISPDSRLSFSKVHRLPIVHLPKSAHGHSIPISQPPDFHFCY